jgi:lipoate-protein ligase B
MGNPNIYLNIDPNDFKLHNISNCGDTEFEITGLISDFKATYFSEIHIKNQTNYETLVNVSDIIKMNKVKMPDLTT